MIKKSLCILSLLSTPVLFGMDGGSETVTITEEVSAPRIISEIAQLIEQAKDTTKELEDRLAALTTASEKTDQLRGQALTPESVSVISRQLGEIRGRIPALICAAIKGKIVQLRNTICSGIEIEEGRATRSTLPQARASLHETFQAQFATRDEALHRNELEISRLQEVVSNLRQTIQDRENDIRDFEIAIAELSNQLEETSKLLGDKVVHLQKLLEKTIEAKEKAEKLAQDNAAELEACEQIIVELQRRA